VPFNFKKFFKKIDRNDWAVLILVLLMLANIALAGFLLAENRQTRAGQTALDQQVNNINRSLGEIKGQMTEQRSYIIRLQSLMYRLNGGGEDDQDN